MTRHALKGRHLQDKIVETFEQKVSAAKGVSRERGWVGEAVLEEIAAQRLGGQERLARAVQRGAVRVFQQGAGDVEVLHAQMRPPPS